MLQSFAFKLAFKCFLYSYQFIKEPKRYHICFTLPFFPNAKCKFSRFFHMTCRVPKSAALLWHNQYMGCLYYQGYSTHKKETQPFLTQIVNCVLLFHLLKTFYRPCPFRQILLLDQKPLHILLPFVFLTRIPLKKFFKNGKNCNVVRHVWR